MCPPLYPLDSIAPWPASWHQTASMASTFLWVGIAGMVTAPAARWRAVHLYKGATCIAMAGRRQTRKELNAVDPDEYMRYLINGGPVAAEQETEASVETAERIAAESSKGFIDEDSDLRWYLVQCTPGFERSIERSFMAKVAHVGLEEDIVDVYVPLRRSLVYSKRAKDYLPKDEPLMPGYVMVHMRMYRCERNTDRVPISSHRLGCGQPPGRPGFSGPGTLQLCSRRLRSP